MLSVTLLSIDRNFTIAWYCNHFQYLFIYNLPSRVYQTHVHSAVCNAV